MIDSFCRFHRSIQTAFADLIRVLTIKAPGEDDRRTARRLVSFFGGPLIWHDHDEEVSLLPRMRRKLGAADGESLAVCGRWHDAMEQQVDELAPLLSAFADGAARAPAPLVRRARALQRLLDDHLRMEEDEVFPLARRILSADELAIALAEVQARARERRLSRVRVVELPEEERRALEKSIETAIHQAIDLARSRGASLAAVTLRGSDPGGQLVEMARKVLLRFGVRNPEVQHEPVPGPVRLASIELAHFPRPL